MDLTLTPEESHFRDEIRGWLDAHHPGPSPEDVEDAFDFRLTWQRTLHEAGYAGIAWPREYGGRGAQRQQPPRHPPHCPLELARSPAASRDSPR